MSDITILSDVMTSENIEQLYQTVSGLDFPWFHSQICSHDAQGVRDKAPGFNSQFCHFVVDTSPFQLAKPHPSHDLFTPIIGAVMPDIVFRMKVNVTTPWHGTQEDRSTFFHTDYSGGEIWNHTKTGIFYINTNDGGTEFEDGTFVQSEAGKMVIFSSQTRHRGVRSSTDTRYVVNINYA